jgi:hypothetical protein
MSPHSWKSPGTRDRFRVSKHCLPKVQTSAKLVFPALTNCRVLDFSDDYLLGSHECNIHIPKHPLTISSLGIVCYDYPVTSSTTWPRAKMTFKKLQDRPLSISPVPQPRGRPVIMFGPSKWTIPTLCLVKLSRFNGHLLVR